MPADPTEWDAIADTWIEDTNAGRNLYREWLLDPWMLDACGDVCGLRVIDLGCGEGRFSRMLAERGACVTGIDTCPRFIEHASAHTVGGDAYALADAQNLSGYGDGSFDLAVSYVSLVDIPDLDRAVREAHRVLRPGGRFVVANLQPMCTAANGWLKDEDGAKVHFRLDDYFAEGVREMPLCRGRVTNYHRTLSRYVNTFLECGFVLEGLREPMPSPEQVAACPDVADNLRVPYFLIYLLRKA